MDTLVEKDTPPKNYRGTWKKEKETTTLNQTTNFWVPGKFLGGL